MTRDDRRSTHDHTAGRSTPGTRLLLSLAVAAGAATVGALLALTWDGEPGTVEELVVQGLRVVGVATSGWYLVAGLLAAVTLGLEGLGGGWRTGRTLVRRFGPRLVQRLVGASAVAGVSLAALVGPASAVPDDLTVGPVVAAPAATAPDPTSTDPVTPVHVPPVAVGGATPEISRPTAPVDRPAAVVPVDDPSPAPSLKGRVLADPGTPDDTTAPAPASAPTPASPAPAPAPPPAAGEEPPPATAIDGSAAEAMYTVVAGDSLWRIAQDWAGPDGPTGWQDWYDANRDVVGPDPDLIHPGAQLRAPAGATPAATASPETPTHD
ncbi:LysM peptidoglycan-binding domain-containing protein [Litorihabitans aurantiacus]|uniref:LysM domain-containing protein n=1 Tax=Litorihabitans aurantiacus TaxID=1930061 RepID=A0AA37UWQ8_9MICO|nr:LysM domain-containing protein [Litorihabitans aurantiacus]GMA30652.1 hypothetical protein GCM10025875_06440 [Litorihabitans aurantiacus]